MRFRFLGTGTSSGVPTIGCACDVCASADPRDTRLRVSAALRFDDPTGSPRTILIDAGPDLRQQALTARLDRLDAILLTHNHVDHVFGLDEVRRFNVVMDAPIDIYADERTLASVRRVYQHIFEPHTNVQRSFVATLIAHQIDPLDPFEIHGVRVTPLPLLHGKLPILGYRFDAVDPALQRAARGVLPLAYCTDVSSIPPETWAHLTGLETLVLDALRVRHHPTHFNLDQAVDAADRIGAARTWFVHMSHDLGHAETDARLPETMSLAYDGLEIPAAGADS